jgi:hypothetical protein
MVWLLTALLLMLTASRVEAASHTLVCAGTIIINTIPKEGVAPAPYKEIVPDFSIVVDLEKRAVFGFGSVEDALPITAADANTVSFQAHRKVAGLEESIEGQIDRSIGAINATDFTNFPNGSTEREEWDLHCKPAEPLL